MTSATAFDSDTRFRLRPPPPAAITVGRHAGNWTPQRSWQRAALAWERVRTAWRLQWATRVLAGRSGPLRLCLGRARASIAGWVTVDDERGADLRIDLRRGLPLPDACVSLIYADQCIERLEFAPAQALLRECRRVLVPGGVLRLATPDLTEALAAFAGAAADTGADQRVRALNQAFRGAHHYLYDEAELRRCLREAGFHRSERRRAAVSQRPELAGLETRDDSALIVEAWCEQS